MCARLLSNLSENLEQEQHVNRPRPYAVLDSAKVACYDASAEIAPPAPGAASYGQDAQFERNKPSYTLSADGRTVCDNVTGLAWQQSPETDGDGAITVADKMVFEKALAYPAIFNEKKFAGFDDSRLPNVKELQSIIDYTRSPDTTQSAAIDPLFACTQITNEAGQPDYPFYWTSTTHAGAGGRGDTADYMAFGRAMGYMAPMPAGGPPAGGPPAGGPPADVGATPTDEAAAGAPPAGGELANTATEGAEWVDVHGAGAQRSDPKMGDPAEFSYGRGPQGDAIRILNYLRLVRDAG
jgi:hypothetical protein